MLRTKEYNVDLDETNDNSELRRCEERLRLAEEREAKLRTENRDLIQSVRNLTQSNLHMASLLSRGNKPFEKETLMHIEYANSNIEKVRLTHMEDRGACSAQCQHIKMCHSGIVKCIKM